MRESNFHFPSQNKACVCITSALYDRRAIDSTSPLPLLSTLTHLSYLTSTSPRIREILCADGGIERLVSLLVKIGKRMRAQRDMARKEGKLVSSSASSVSSSSVGGDSESSGVQFRSPFKPFGIVKRQIAAEAAASGQSGALPLAAHQAAAIGLTKEQKHTLWTWSLAFQCVVNVGVRGSENVRTRVVEAGVVPIVIGVLGGFLHDLDRKRSLAEKADRDKRRRAEKSGISLSAPSRSSHRHGHLSNQTDPLSQLLVSSNQAEIPSFNPPVSRSVLPQVEVHPATPNPAHSHASLQSQARPFWDAQGSIDARTRSRLVTSSSLSRQSTVDQTPEGSEEGSVTGEEEDEVVDGDTVMDIESTLDKDKSSTCRRQRRGTIKASSRGRTDASSSSLSEPPVVRLHTLSEHTGSAPSSLSALDNDGDINMQDLQDAPGQTPRALASRLLSTDETWSGTVRMQAYATSPFMASSQSGMTITMSQSPRAVARDSGQMHISTSRSGSLAPGDFSDAPGTPEDEVRMSAPADRNADANTSGARLSDTPLPPLVTNPTTSSQSLEDSFASAPPSPSSQLCFRDEDVLLALQLLAYLSKYPHVRAKFHEPADKMTLELAYGSTAEAARAVASFAGKVKAERGERERMKEQHRLAKEGKLSLPAGQDKDRRRCHGSSVSTFSSATDASKASSTSTSSTASVVSINPLSTNVFSFVERFTHRSSSHDKHALAIPEPIQYWAGVIMRNACRKDESRGGIRQCANMQCGVWEQFPREFAKCRRCRKAKYCSKTCQSKAWQLGHRFWCSVKDADPVADGTATAAGDGDNHSHGLGTAVPSLGDEVGTNGRVGRRRQRDVTASDDEDTEYPTGVASASLGASPFVNPIPRPGGGGGAGGTTGPGRTESPDDGAAEGHDALRTLGEMNAQLVHAAAAAVVAAGDLGVGGVMLQDEADVARRMLMSLNEGEGEEIMVGGVGPGGRNGLMR